MPIYEYQCTGCAYRFEVKQSIKDDPIKECARCGKEVTKLISPRPSCSKERLVYHRLLGQDEAGRK